MGTEGLLSISFVSPHDCEADQELWLSTTAQHHERVLYQMSIAREKIKIKKLKYSSYWMNITYTPSWSWKILSQIMVSHRPSVYTSYLQLFLGLVLKLWSAETAWTSSLWFFELLQSKRNTDSSTPGYSSNQRAQEVKKEHLTISSIGTGILSFLLKSDQ